MNGSVRSSRCLAGGEPWARGHPCTSPAVGKLFAIPTAGPPPPPALTWDRSHGARSGARPQTPPGLPALLPVAPGRAAAVGPLPSLAVSCHGAGSEHCSRTLVFGHGSSPQGGVYVRHRARVSGVSLLSFGARTPLSGRGACGPRPRPRQPVGGFFHHWLVLLILGFCGSGDSGVVVCSCPLLWLCPSS